MLRHFVSEIRSDSRHQLFVVMQAKHLHWAALIGRIILWAAFCFAGRCQAFAPDFQHAS